jgi:dephospho-CoA kinase
VSKNLAFAGKQGSGKTHLAKSFELLGWSRVSIAAPIKDLVGMAYPNQPKDAPALIRGEQRTVREVYQEVGRSLRESISADFWFNIALNRINEQRHKGRFVVVDDVRTPLECEMLRANGFTIVRLNVPDEVRAERIGGIIGGGDYTEKGVDMLDPDVELSQEGITTVLDLAEEAGWTMMTPRHENALARLMAAFTANQVHHVASNR